MGLAQAKTMASRFMVDTISGVTRLGADADKYISPTIRSARVPCFFSKLVRLAISCWAQFMLGFPSYRAPNLSHRVISGTRPEGAALVMEMAAEPARRTPPSHPPSACPPPAGRWSG